MVRIIGTVGLVALLLLGCSRSIPSEAGLEQELVECKKQCAQLAEAQPPVIESLRLLGPDNEPLQKKDGWIHLEHRTRVVAKVGTKATKVDFYVAPTGTDWYMQQKLIGSVYPDASTAELEWSVPPRFTGRLWIIAYNGNIGRRSEDLQVMSSR